MTQNDTIIEGLTGRLPFLVSGIIFFLANTICFQIRGFLHAELNVIDGNQFTVIVVGWLVIVLVIAPLMHTLTHALAIRLAGKPLRWFRTWWYPRVRPAATVSRPEALRILLAPVALSLILLMLLIIPAFSGAFVVWSSVNIALSANDIWKAIGLMRISPKARLSMETDHLRVEGSA